MLTIWIWRVEAVINVTQAHYSRMEAVVNGSKWRLLENILLQKLSPEAQDLVQ